MTAVACYAALALALFIGIVAGIDNLAFLMAMLFVAFACLGLVIPSTVVLALEDHGPIAGMASALVRNAAVRDRRGRDRSGQLFFDGTALPMVTTIALCAAGAFALTRLTLRRAGGRRPAGGIADDPPGDRLAVSNTAGRA